MIKKYIKDKFNFYFDIIISLSVTILMLHILETYPLKVEIILGNKIFIVLVGLILFILTFTFLSVDRVITNKKKKNYIGRLWKYK